VYRLSYGLGLSRWDTGTIATEVEQAFQNENIPAGPVLDLGCGTGTSVIYMAKLGRQAIGIDFVPQAIAKARVKAQQAGVSDRTKFFTADVTRLSELKLPPCSFALDMGCFHGLNRDGQGRYAQGLADVLIPNGRFMLYVLEPRKEAGLTFGLTAE
jgi:SAM-dependent methyltransferase